LFGVIFKMKTGSAEETADGKSVEEPEVFVTAEQRAIRRRHSRQYPHSVDLGYDSYGSPNAILMSNRSGRGSESFGIARTSILKEVAKDQVSLKQEPNSFFDHVRTLVSKKKRRYVDEGMDLDLTYITKNLIAMGFPSEGMEGLYRNRMKDMQKFFNTKHPKKYVIYNLCSERHYDPDKFEGRVFPFPFDDHNCPPFDDLEPLCESVDTWLSHDPANVAAMHCKAGKGRTGLVICVYLLHTGTWKDAKSALSFYALSRTTNMKGVTIPSQKRWVRYYEKMLKRRATGQFRASRRYRIKSVFVSAKAPKFTEMVVFNEKTQTYNPNETFGLINSTNTMEFNHPQFKEGILLKCRPDLIIHKDVKVQWNHRGRIKKGKTRVFSLWFNTDFIENTNRLLFVKKDIDKVSKQKKTKDFIVCFEFEPLDEVQIVQKGKNALDLNTLKDPEQLVILALMLQDGIHIRNRQWNGKTYMRVFKGVDAVEWLVEEGGAKSVEDAVQIGEILRKHGIIKEVPKADEQVEDKFTNTWQFFRFSTMRDDFSYQIEDERKETVEDNKTDESILSIKDEKKRPIRALSQKCSSE